MEAKNINTTIYVAKVEELDDKDRQLVETSIEATNNSYAPYSRFHVGAAVRLDNGIIIPGCNQENAAFGVTICAERTALFAAGAQYPKAKVEAIAITARLAVRLWWKQRKGAAKSCAYFLTVRIAYILLKV